MALDNPAKTAFSVAPKQPAQPETPTSRPAVTTAKQLFDAGLLQAEQRLAQVVAPPVNTAPAVPQPAPLLPGPFSYPEQPPPPALTPYSPPVYNTQPGSGTVLESTGHRAQQVLQQLFSSLQSLQNPLTKTDLDTWNTQLSRISSTLRLQVLSPAEQLQINQRADRQLGLETQYALGFFTLVDGNLALSGSLNEMARFFRTAGAQHFHSVHSDADGLTLKGLQQRYQQALVNQTDTRVLNAARARLQHIEAVLKNQYPALTLMTQADRSPASQHTAQNDPALLIGLSVPVKMTDNTQRSVPASLAGPLQNLGEFLLKGGYSWLLQNGLRNNTDIGLTPQQLMQRYAQSQADPINLDKPGPQQTGGQVATPLINDVEIPVPNEDSTVNTELPYGDKKQTAISVKPTHADSEENKNNGVIGIQPAKSVQPPKPAAENNNTPIKASAADKPTASSTDKSDPDLFVSDSQLQDMQNAIDADPNYQNIHEIRGTNTKRIDGFNEKTEEIIWATLQQILNNQRADKLHADLSEKRYELQIQHNPDDPKLELFNPNRTSQKIFFTQLLGSYQVAEEEAIQLFLQDKNNLFIGIREKNKGHPGHKIEIHRASKQNIDPQEYINNWRNSNTTNFSQNPSVVHIATTKIDGKKIYLTHTAFRNTTKNGKYLVWRHTNPHIAGNIEDIKIAQAEANKIYDYALEKRPGDRSIIQNMADQFWLRMQSAKLRGAASNSWWGLVSGLRSKGFLVPKLHADVAGLDLKVYTTTREQFVNNFESYFSAPIRYIGDAGAATGGLSATQPQQPQSSQTPSDVETIREAQRIQQQAQQTQQQTHGIQQTQSQWQQQGKHSNLKQEHEEANFDFYLVKHGLAVRLLEIQHGITLSKKQRNAAALWWLTQLNNDTPKDWQLKSAILSKSTTNYQTLLNSVQEAFQQTTPNTFSLHLLQQNDKHLNNLDYLTIRLNEWLMNAKKLWPILKANTVTSIFQDNSDPDKAAKIIWRALKAMGHSKTQVDQFKKDFSDWLLDKELTDFMYKNLRPGELKWSDKQFNAVKAKVASGFDSRLGSNIQEPLKAARRKTIFKNIDDMLYALQKLPPVVLRFSQREQALNQWRNELTEGAAQPWTLLERTAFVNWVENSFPPIPDTDPSSVNLRTAFKKTGFKTRQEAQQAIEASMSRWIFNYTPEEDKLVRWQLKRIQTIEGVERTWNFNERKAIMYYLETDKPINTYAFKRAAETSGFTGAYAARRFKEALVEALK